MMKANCFLSLTASERRRLRDYDLNMRDPWLKVRNRKS